MRHLALPVVLACTITACGDQSNPAEPISEFTPGGMSAAQGRPTEISGEFADPGVCEFPLRIEFSGKAKEIVLGAGRTIFTSPRLFTTITNLENQNQETFSITGAFHQTELANGNVVTVVTGRNLLFDPFAGFVLAIGRFSYAFDAEGFLIQPLEGIGRLIDICELLA